MRLRHIVIGGLLGTGLLAAEPAPPPENPPPEISADDVYAAGSEGAF
jgi:hypothetical protein